MLDWLQIKSNGKTKEANLKLMSQRIQQTPNYTQSVTNCSFAGQCPGCYFFHLFNFYSFYENTNDIIQGANYQRFFIDLITNRNRYAQKLNANEWTLMSKYITTVTGIKEGLTGSILFDILTMKNEKDVSFLNGLWESICGLGFCSEKDPMNFSPSTWTHNNRSLAWIASNCLVSNAGERNITDCVAFEEFFKQTLNGLDFQALAAFFKETMKPEVHVDLDQDWFVPPMIPFCWFRKPFQWMGEPEFQAEFMDYHDFYSQKDKTKILKWCNIFERSFPIYSNCFTTKPNAITGDNVFSHRQLVLI